MSFLNEISATINCIGLDHIMVPIPQSKLVTTFSHEYILWGSHAACKPACLRPLIHLKHSEQEPCTALDVCQNLINANNACYILLDCNLSGYYNCDSALVRLWFDYDDSYQNYDSTRPRKWKINSMLMKARIYTRRLSWCRLQTQTFFWINCYPMLICQCECHSYYHDVHYYVMLCPAHCLLIGYDASRCNEKNEDVYFSSNQSKLNRKRISVEL